MCEEGIVPISKQMNDITDRATIKEVCQLAADDSDCRTEYDVDDLIGKQCIVDIQYLNGIDRPPLIIINHFKGMTAN
ncbi:hypothetical protein KP77_28550 [Jeotgalibacillus alimentarius]|uniref:Uncharacterized protein n=2 Tax=Jeotgalibacillus alimentarius TaxID=135826 RepID=A0A0C2VNJ2_9BACL|nr:hypothetical protein KP77_28550 [Jeotgalibacillus alimentarius]